MTTQTVQEVATNVWAEIYEELTKRGVVFPDNFDGIGAAYAGHAILANALSQERTRLKEEIEQSRIENASHGCLATNCEDPICGHTRCIDWMYGELLERLSKLTH